MKLLKVILIATAVTFAVNLLAAQAAIFGLAEYHVRSGLAGPFFLACAAEIILITGVGIGSRDT